MIKLYRLLGVSPSATPQEIRRAFRRRARELHPDVSKDPEATEKFKALEIAYSILIKKLAPSRYDRPQTRRHKPSPVEKPPPEEVAHEQEEIIHICAEASSPDGTYRLSWRDADPAEDARILQGYKQALKRTFKFDHDPGEFQLRRGGRLIYQKILQRPNDGRVANNGTAIFNDWLRKGSDGELSGEFCAFGVTGEELLRLRFEANLVKNAISDDGTYALCTTAFTKAKGPMIAFFALSPAKLLWKQPLGPPQRWPDQYLIHPESRSIEFVFKSVGSYELDFEGHYVDRRKWQCCALDRADGFMVQDVVREVLSQHETPDRDLLERAVRGLDRTLSRGFEQRFGERIPKFEAVSYRLKGEVYERLGDRILAKGAYMEALKRDPKVGVRRRMAELG